MFRRRYSPGRPMSRAGACSAYASGMITCIAFHRHPEPFRTEPGRRSRSRRAIEWRSRSATARSATTSVRHGAFDVRRRTENGRCRWRQFDTDRTLSWTPGEPVWTPRWMQARIFASGGMWSGADVCPASCCGLTCRGPVWRCADQVQFGYARSRRRPLQLVFPIPSR